MEGLMGQLTSRFARHVLLFWSHMRGLFVLIVVGLPLLPSDRTHAAEQIIPYIASYFYDGCTIVLVHDAQPMAVKVTGRCNGHVFAPTKKNGPYDCRVEYHTAPHLVLDCIVDGTFYSRYEAIVRNSPSPIGPSAQNRRDSMANEVGKVAPPASGRGDTPAGSAEDVVEAEFLQREKKAQLLADTRAFPELLILTKATHDFVRSRLGPSHRLTLRAFASYAGSFTVVGNPDQALALLYNIHKQVVSRFGDKELVAVEVRLEISQALFTKGRYLEALDGLRSAYRDLVTLLGEEDEKSIQSLLNLAFYFERAGRTDEGISLYPKLLALTEKKLGPTHSYSIIAINNYASALLALGRINEAIAAFTNFLARTEQKNGRDSRDFLIAQNNYAMALVGSGQTARALGILQDALARSQQMNKERDELSLTLLNTYGHALKEVGRVEEALPYFERAYRLRSQAYDELHPEAFRAGNNYASALAELNRGVAAVTLLKKIVDQSSERLGPSHLDTLAYVANYGMVLQKFGLSRDAEPILQTALKRTIDAQGRNHPNTLRVFRYYTLNQIELRRDQLAVQIATESLALHTTAMGDLHPNTLEALELAGRANIRAGRRKTAISLFERFIDGTEQLRHFAAADSVETQRAVLARAVPTYKEYMQALLDEGRFSEAFQVLERTKGRSLLDQIAHSEALRSGILSAPEIDKWEQLSQHISAIDRRISDVVTIAEGEKLQSERGKKTRELAAILSDFRNRYPKFRQLSEVNTASPRDASSLVPGSALFISYSVSATEHVSAVTLTADQKVTWHDLGQIAGLEDSVETLRAWLSSTGASRTHFVSFWKVGEVPHWRSVTNTNVCTEADLSEHLARQLRVGRKLQSTAVSTMVLVTNPRERVALMQQPGLECRPPEGRVYQPGSEEEARAISDLISYLGQRLIAPLRNQLVGKSELVISPDGPLGLLPFDVLRLENTPLIARFETSLIHSLSVLKLITARQREYFRAQQRESLLAFGNPNYEGKPGTELGQRTSGQSLAQRRTFFDNGGQAGRSFTEVMRNQSWSNLSYAADEIATSTELFSGQGPRAITWNDATESTLRKLSTSGELARYRYLLFSAHGYFDPVMPNNSALVLKAESDEPHQDGYITTGEWTTLRLRSDLAILSACDTARGVAINGEGLMGLAYALYVAGNTSTIVTLWPVNDKTTASFIVDFLARIKQGELPRRALTATKRAFIKSSNPEERKEYLWAPFILYGV